MTSRSSLQSASIPMSSRLSCHANRNRQGVGTPQHTNYFRNSGIISKAKHIKLRRTPPHRVLVVKCAKVAKTDFILALRELGLVFTHGQATALAADHHHSYERFLSSTGDANRSLEVSPTHDGELRNA